MENINSIESLSKIVELNLQQVLQEDIPIEYKIMFLDYMFETLDDEYKSIHKMSKATVYMSENGDLQYAGGAIKTTLDLLKYQISSLMESVLDAKSYIMLANDNVSFEQSLEHYKNVLQ